MVIKTPRHTFIRPMFLNYDEGRINDLITTTNAMGGGRTNKTS
jgi:hypothetical protein